MTTAPATFTPHPLVSIRPGDHIWTWCQAAMDRTDHLYQPDKSPPLKCLCSKCNPPSDEQGSGDKAQ